jgi:tyrosine-protein kinase Etk/Wzc
VDQYLQIHRNFYRIEQLIEHYKEYFDYILIDTTPVELVADITLLASLPDVTFYIIRHEKSPKVHLKNIKDLSNRKLFKSLHIILNSVNYKNSLDYGCGYGYYGETKKSKMSKLKSL